MYVLQKTWALLLPGKYIGVDRDHDRLSWRRSCSKAKQPHATCRVNPTMIVRASSWKPYDAIRLVQDQHDGSHCSILAFQPCGLPSCCGLRDFVPPRSTITQYLLLLDHGVERKYLVQAADGRQPHVSYRPQHRASQPAPRASGYRSESFLNKVCLEGTRKPNYQEQSLSSKGSQHTDFGCPLNERYAIVGLRRVTAVS